MTESSFDKVKKLMKIIGGKAIIVEDEKPAFVIINVDEYLDFEDTKNSIGSEMALLDKINRDINVWKNKQRDREISQMEKDFIEDKAKKRLIEIV
ncbi:MAG: hypothetical protein PHI66_01540 [Candidatus Pacebacteria bacterium]|nr:hypothetical protein [Candidatus Paceibacterota bacterium]